MNHCFATGLSSIAQWPVPSTHFGEEDGSTPRTLRRIHIILLAANCIFFQANLSSEPAIHQGRSPASKRLVPGAVLGIASQDPGSAVFRQIIRPLWFHKIEYRRNRLRCDFLFQASADASPEGVKVVGYFSGLGDANCLLGDCCSPG